MALLLAPNLYVGNEEFSFWHEVRLYLYDKVLLLAFNSDVLNVNLLGLVTKLSYDSVPMGSQGTKQDS